MSFMLVGYAVFGVCFVAGVIGYICVSRAFLQPQKVYVDPQAALSLQR